jgi:hypothetical protein
LYPGTAKQLHTNIKKRFSFFSFLLAARLCAPKEIGEASEEMKNLFGPHPKVQNLFNEEVVGKGWGRRNDMIIDQMIVWRRLFYVLDEVFRTTSKSNIFDQ